MLKTGLKAFAYSFSVSLFAILAANRCFWHTQTSSDTPLVISSKNISLFLKNGRTAAVPSKKIVLSSLPDIPKESPAETQNAPDVILADASEAFDFPLKIEAESFPSAAAETTDSHPIVLTDILYSPQNPLPEPKIDSEPVYTPEVETDRRFIPPQAETVLALASDKNPDSRPLSESPQDSGNPLLIPLQQSSQPDGKTVALGNPSDLNHIALNDSQVPISSMGSLGDSDEQPSVSKDWIKAEDNPWVVAKSAAGAKNQLAVKEFSSKSDTEISEALTPQKQRSGVQVASETVDNLIIPIPKDILDDKDLTPKLAYPSSSEDAEKEKSIDEKIKQQNLEKDTKKTSLLTALEDDISLEAPKETASDSKVSATSSKPNLINTLSSLFTSSKKKLSPTKEGATAKAQARRNFRKKQAQVRPVSIMPTEIRLSFQPNKAEISGQTLRWIQAFGAKAAETPNMWLEIRIDGTNSTILQQRRLNLLYNILTNKGVDYSKINTVFTAREPNSFILRTVTSDTEHSGGSTGKTNLADEGKYIQW